MVEVQSRKKEEGIQHLKPTSSWKKDHLAQSDPSLWIWAGRILPPVSFGSDRADKGGKI